MVAAIIRCFLKTKKRISMELLIILITVSLITIIPPILWTYGSYKKLLPAVRIANACIACIPFVLSLGYVVPQIIIPRINYSTFAFIGTLIAYSCVICLTFTLLNELSIAQYGKHIIPTYRKPIYILGTCGHFLMCAVAITIL